jgi:hypothetical protein
VPKIPKGFIKGGDRTHGSNINFKCNKGYQLIGPSSARCDDGRWSEDLPYCSGVCDLFRIFFNCLYLLIDNP